MYSVWNNYQETRFEIAPEFPLGELRVFGMGSDWSFGITIRARKHVHLWPFDGCDIPARRSAVAEVNPDQISGSCLFRSAGLRSRSVDAAADSSRTMATKGRGT